MTWPVEGVREFCARALGAAGLTPEHASILADALVDAELRGRESHGVGRLVPYIQRVRAGGISTAEPRIVQDGGATMLWDGQNAAGQVVGAKVMQSVMERARTHGVAVAVVQNSSHLGHLGYLAAMAANEGLVGGCLSNASPRLAAWGGKRAVLGNNPWAIAFPSSAGQPVVVDMANSAVAAGKIREVARKGERIPEGWALNAQGEPTTDPVEALSGILLPAGGPKGYAIALAVSLMTAGLADGVWDERVTAVDDPAAPQQMSQVFWAMDPCRFIAPEAYAARIDEAAEIMRRSGPAVLVPGERGEGSARERRANGLSLSGKLVDELRGVAAELGISFTLENMGG